MQEWLVVCMQEWLMQEWLVVCMQEWFMQEWLVVVRPGAHASQQPKEKLKSFHATDTPACSI